MLCRIGKHPLLFSLHICMTQNMTTAKLGYILKEKNVNLGIFFFRKRVLLLDLLM